MTSKAFNVEEKSLTEFFGDSKSFYQIPDYQRPYSWGDEQALKLWDDIFEAYNNQSKNYFLGTIVTTNGKDNRYDVIDGQQRITTLTILFAVIKSFYPNDSDSNYETIIDSIVSRRNKENRVRFYTHNQRQTNFEKLINNTDFEIFINEKSKKDVKKDKFQNVAFEFAIKINETLKQRDFNIVSFIEFILNSIFLIRINCSNESSAIKIFNTLNDRGLDLRQSDIIKSKLLYKLLEENKQDSENIRKTFVNDWDEMNKVISEEYDNFDAFLTVYLLTKTGKNPENSLSEELEKVFKNATTKDVILDIKSFVKDFEESIANKQNSNNKNYHIKSLEYIPWRNYWVAILMTAIVNKYKDIEKLIKLIHRFYYLNWIAGNTASKIKQTTFNCIKLIKNSEKIENVEKELFSGLIKFKDVEDRVKSCLKNDVYGESWIRALLTTLEYKRKEESEFIEFSQKVQVEHILPQTFENQNGYDFAQEDHKNYVNKIGNLTLLSYRNQKASNKDFDTKLNVYSGKGVHGIENDGANKFQITQDIEKDYCINKSWSVESFNKRQEELLNDIYKIFDLKK